IIEANSGNTGYAFDWFKDAFFSEIYDNPYNVIESFLKNSKPGANCTYAYLGPEHMSFKETTNIKRGIFIFEPPSMVSENLPQIKDFVRSVIENIGFGILENYNGLRKLSQNQSNVYIGGGMTKSDEFCNILANILGIKLMKPHISDTAFLGTAMLVLVGTNEYNDYNSIINSIFQYRNYDNDDLISDNYKNLFKEWKHFKNQLDNL
ncbi:MAG: FGGY-family carbohydrate kinase, partial [Promethearchaeota archaeon]